ncbi:MAG: P-II family nitrogen regulator [Methanoregula sp.]|nr:P-II family nitrogen regulator [Methanoregula sp.]
MKKIEAFVRPEQLNNVRKTLVEIGHRTMINYDIWYRGTENEIHRHNSDGNTPLYDFMPKAKIELIAKDDEVQSIIDAICDCACTGHTGDGKIFVLPVETAIRIQTKEMGDTVF